MDQTIAARHLRVPRRQEVTQWLTQKMYLPKKLRRESQNLSQKVHLHR